MTLRRRHSQHARLLTLSVLTPLMLAGTTFGQEEEPPDSIDVVGIVRDFREHDVPGGHPDFEVRPQHGFARYSGNHAAHCSEDRKPVFTGAGHKMASQFRDSEGRQICHLLYDPALGDTEGNWSQAGTGAIASTESFDQWYRDVPGVNISAPLGITLVRQDDGHYVFDDQLDPYYANLGGFFPIDDSLFGNFDSDHNFHFTFEFHMEFIYDATGDQFFKFIGDDDVYVFINDELVIDLGGVHAAHDQYVDMNRLGLSDGELYKIDFFYAERHRNTSNFRIETNLPFRTMALPTFTMVYD